MTCDVVICSFEDEKLAISNHEKVCKSAIVRTLETEMIVLTSYITQLDTLL